MQTHTGKSCSGLRRNRPWWKRFHFSSSKGRSLLRLRSKPTLHSCDLAEGQARKKSEASFQTHPDQEPIPRKGGEEGPVALGHYSSQPIYIRITRAVKKTKTMAGSWIWLSFSSTVYLTVRSILLSYAERQSATHDTHLRTRKLLWCWFICNRRRCVCVWLCMCLYINARPCGLCTRCHRSSVAAWGWSLSSLVLMKSLLSACNFSRFISTVISKGSLWRPSSSADLGLSNENIIYPVTSECQEMVCWLFSDSLEIGSCGEELWGFVKHETKGGLAPQSTVSGLRDFRKMHPSIWKILCGTICMFAKLRVFFPQWKYLLRKKKGNAESIYFNAILSFAVP